MSTGVNRGQPGPYGQLSQHIWGQGQEAGAGQGVGYVDMDRAGNRNEAESQPLLEFLYRHLDRPEFQCLLDWQEGTVILWDNRSVQHVAGDGYAGQTRVMRRVTIAGETLV